MDDNYKELIEEFRLYVDEAATYDLGAMMLENSIKIIESQSAEIERLNAAMRDVK